MTADVRKILVLGASGLIGRFVTDDLRGRGFSVVGIARKLSASQKAGALDLELPVMSMEAVALARLLRAGGEFRFATDISHYAGWTLARVLRSPDFAWTAQTAADWREPWPGFVRTRYEAKAIREGRTPAYFIFRRE